MSESHTEIETPETPETEQAPEAHEETSTGFVARLRQVGETGKKEWEQALGQAGQSAKKLREAAAARSEVLFARAQERGASLLLKLIVQVRRGAESLEQSLVEGRARQEASEAAEPAAA